MDSLDEPVILWRNKDFRRKIIQPLTLKNDEPMFFLSVAEVYEKQQKTEMALEFYKLALNLYRKETTGPLKLMGQKIESLEKELEKQAG